MSEIHFSYWMAKIKARKKIRQNAALPGTPNLRESLPPISQQNQYSSRIFAARLVWITVDVGKHKT